MIKAFYGFLVGLNEGRPKTRRIGWPAEQFIGWKMHFRIETQFSLKQIINYQSHQKKISCCFQPYIFFLIFPIEIIRQLEFLVFHGFQITTLTKQLFLIIMPLYSRIPSTSQLKEEKIASFSNSLDHYFCQTGVMVIKYDDYYIFQGAQDINAGHATQGGKLFSFKAKKENLERIGSIPGELNELNTFHAQVIEGISVGLNISLPRAIEKMSLVKRNIAKNEIERKRRLKINFEKRIQMDDPRISVENIYAIFQDAGDVQKEKCIVEYQLDNEMKIKSTLCKNILTNKPIFHQFTPCRPKQPNRNFRMELWQIWQCYPTGGGVSKWKQLRERRFEPISQQQYYIRDDGRSQIFTKQIQIFTPNRRCR